MTLNAKVIKVVREIIKTQYKPNLGSWEDIEIYVFFLFYI
jgi:hypothetical protein